MLVFVDESGDTGRKIEKGSSSYFVVVLVMFDENEEAEKVDKRISLLKHEMGKRDGFEFHFTKLDRGQRLRFLEAVAPYDFGYFAILVNKDPQVLHGPGFQYRESFYKAVTKYVFTLAKPYLSQAKVVIDGSADREFRQSLRTYLRKQINEPGVHYIKKVEFQRSQSNNLIQLADMIAGALHRTKRLDKDDKETYWQSIKSKEFYVQEWPRK